MTNVFSKLAEEAKPEKTGGEAGFFLATVATADSNGITFIPDGQTAATQKRYKMIASGPMPVEGDRVVVMKHSGTCVVLGIIGMPEEPVTDEYVLKAGDTMTGALTVKSNVILDSTTQAIGTRPQSSIADRYVRFRDKNGLQLAALQDVFMNNGDVGFELVSSRTNNDTYYSNFLRMIVDENGNAGVYVNVPQSWRSALGLGTNGAFPLTIAQGGSGNTATYYTTTVSEICTANSTEFTITSAKYAQWGKIASISVAGTGLKAHTNETIVMFTMASGKRPKIDSSARAWRNTSSLLHTDGTLDFSGTWAANSGFTFISTYLLA